MKSMLTRRAFIARLALAACAPAALRVASATAGDAPAALPGDSIYQFHAPLTDQDDRSFDLASLRGGPVLASMFYSECQLVCPMIFETLQQTVAALTPAERAHVRVLMISFDPARDTPAALRRTAAAHGCGAAWTLARTDADSTRRIAALLGVQYRRLPSGEFNHSASIALLDRDGRIAARSGKLGAVDANLLEALRAAAEARRG